MLQDRVAIITGGGRGIGREHALLFASLGAKVVVNDLGGAVDGSGTDVSAAQSVVDEITAAGGQAVANTDSVSSFAGAKAMVDQAVSSFGDLHVVVNNAGILRDRMLVSMSEEEFDAFGKATAKAVGIRGSARFFPWVFDGAQSVERQAVLSMPPPPVRLLCRFVWEPRYPRRAASLWGA